MSTTVTAGAAETGPGQSGAAIEHILLSEGLLTTQQLTYAKRVHDKLGQDYSLVRVLTDLDYITTDGLRTALRNHGQTIPLGTLLVELGHIRPAELSAALEAQKAPEYKGKRLGEFLVEKHLIQEQELIGVLADQLGFEPVEPRLADIPAELMRRVKPGWCRRFNAIPLKKEGDRVHAAFVDPLDQQARQAFESLFGEIVPSITSRRVIEDVVGAYERKQSASSGHDGASTESTATMLVDDIVVAALTQGASDIHIEPTRTRVRVRFRLDGVLQLNRELDTEVLPALSNRLKVLAGADIAERRRHQGGSFRFQDPRSGERCDVRCSWYSTIFGEKIVLRLLSRKAELLDVREVGMTQKTLARFVEEVLDVPSGVILITGPTGSGKTTSLYGCVNYLNDSERSIVTAEDPVEYVIDGIAQCSLNPKLDVTFADALKHMMRQDPDVIVLGEIRDQFSAEAAIQAALTGHKVLTTFHTEDSIGGLLRLMNMNIETFLISSTVVSVLAQRLIRHVCERCAEPYRPQAHVWQRLAYSAADLAGATFRRGRGCEHCHYTGYSGRVGVFELLVLNEAVKDAILARKPSSEIRRISVESSGLITLLEDGILKAAAGLTTIEEVLRHLPRLNRPRPLRDLRRLAGPLTGEDKP